MKTYFCTFILPAEMTFFCMHTLHVWNHMIEYIFNRIKNIIASYTLRRNEINFI